MSSFGNHVVGCRGPVPALWDQSRRGLHHGFGRVSRGLLRRQATPRLLPLVVLRPVPSRRGIPGAGPPAAPQPRHVQALPRRAGGAAGSRRALRRRRDAHPRRRGGTAGAGSPRAAARLPRDRGVPRALAELDRNAPLLERELGEAVPVALDRRGHLLLLPEDLARRVRRLLVAGPLGDPRQELVARDLEVLRRVSVARAAARLLAPREVDDALHQRPDDAARLLDDRGRLAVRLQALLHPLRVPLRLDPVLLERPLDL